MTFKTNLLPQTDSGWELGSSSLGWKITKINAPTTAGGSTYGPGSNGNVLMSNGSSVYWGSSGDMGFVAKAGDTMTGSLYVNVTTDTAANQDTGAIIVGDKAGENIAIDTNEIMARNNKATSTLYLNNDGGAIQFGGLLQPKTDSAQDIGTTTLHWRHGYFDDLFVSTNTGYTATNSAVGGTAITTGQIDITGATPKIQLHRATAAAITGTIQSETDYGITLNGVPSATGAAVYITGSAPATGFTYSGRTVKPILRINGVTYSNACIETGAYFLNNTNGGNNTGYFLYGNNNEYARLYIGKRGTAAVSDGGETPVYTNTTGETVLVLGNAKQGSSGNSGSVVDNSKGILKIYGAGTQATDIQRDNYAGLHISGNLTASIEKTTYNSRTITPLVKIDGLTYIAGEVETNNSFSTNSNGVNNGVYIKANNIQVAKFVHSALGKIGILNSETSEYTGFTAGTATLELGNNLQVGSTTSAGAASNASGILKIWGRWNQGTEIKRDDTSGLHITGTVLTANEKTTYNSRTISPLMRVDGLIYSSGCFETADRFISNKNGTTGGFQLKNRDIEYGALWINKLGTAAVESSGNYTNTTGETILTLGNNRQGTNGNSASVIDNTKGILRLYGAGTNYTDIQALQNGNHITYIPAYNGDMYLTHTSNANAVGSSNVPVYVAANGRITTCLPYATCTTAVGTVAKVVTLAGYTLATGSKIVINFTAGANTANNPTLNINNTGAKQIYHRNSQITTGDNKALLQGACEFVYDGTRYHLVGNYYDTTYSAATTSAAGLMPALPSSNGTTQYLRGDGTWQNVPVTSVATKTGDVTLGTLTIGDATYNGSTDTIISIADLGLASTTTFWGITSTAITDGSTTGTVNITIGPTTGNRTATSSDNGVVVMRADNGDEYIWTGNKWNLMGLASSYALASHVHGNITSTGTIASDTAVASGQHLMVTDSNNKVSRSSLTFGTDTSKYLRNDGTWQIVSTADEKVKQTAKTDNVNYKLLFTTSASPTSGNAAEAAYDANITINPSTHKITATTFAGNLTGDVTGNLTGDVTGNLIGNVTGNVTGDLTGNADTASAITQTVKTDNASYNLLISSTSNLTSGEAYGVSYDAGIDINPNTHTLTASNFVGSLTGNVTGNASTADLATLATGANITTTTNGVAYYSDTGGTFANLSSANGALYATSANGALNFGTLPVQQGGTGMTSLTANRIIKGNGTSALIASGVSLDASDNMSGVVAITASGIISTTNTTASTSTTTGAIKSAGGIAAAGQVTATRLAANGSNTSYNLYVNGSSYLNGNSTVKTVIGTSNSTYGDTLPSSASEGQIFFQIADGENTATKISPVAATTSTKYYIIGTQGTGAYTPYVASPNASGTKNTGGIYFQGSTGVLYGAAWNDYAEYRQKSNIGGIPYGKVVIENGDDTVSLSTARLQPCGQIISDTFGFILGPEENSLPIALCGRVLAYPYEDRNSFEVGDAVCTAPDGKISKMTREEIREWPDRILGYVSSIPQYEIWEEKDIVVDGRIWIKVK